MSGVTTQELIFVGILVVFITLGILTLSTYITGWLVEKFYGDRDDDEKEKVAAIVAAIRAGGNT